MVTVLTKTLVSLLARPFVPLLFKNNISGPREKEIAEKKITIVSRIISLILQHS
jgi:hypothetical protein